MIRCDERWIESAEVFCMHERGHAGEHGAAATMEYADGTVAEFEISWNHQSGEMTMQEIIT